MEEKKISLVKKADFWIAVIMFAFSSMILYQIITINIADSKMMPSLVFFISILSSIAMMNAAIRNKKNIVEIGELRFSKKELAAVFLLFITYYIVKVIGFWTGVAFLTLSFSILIWNEHSKKDILMFIIYNIILIIALYIVFIKLFGMVMPKGIFY